jgi:hypothetical protein
MNTFPAEFNYHNLNKKLQENIKKQQQEQEKRDLLPELRRKFFENVNSSIQNCNPLSHLQLPNILTYEQRYKIITEIGKLFPQMRCQNDDDTSFEYNPEKTQTYYESCVCIYVDLFHNF